MFLAEQPLLPLGSLAEKEAEKRDKVFTFSTHFLHEFILMDCRWWYSSAFATYYFVKILIVGQLTLTVDAKSINWSLKSIAL